MSHHGHSHTELSPQDVCIPAGHRWTKLPLIFAVVGVLGLAATIGLGLSHRHQLFFSYLFAYMYWISFALGGLLFVLLQFVARAGWSVVVRRIAEIFMSTMPLFLVLFIPIAVGLGDLYHWVHADANDKILAHKAPYLNAQFFLVRAGFYLLVWCFLALWYWSKTTQQDKTGDALLTRKMQNASGPAILAFAFTSTWAAFDWLMSLEPHWYSTIYGAYYFAAYFVSTFSLMVLVATAFNRAQIMKVKISTEHFHDLGKLMFAFTVFWAYMAFSQYMLIWYANMPEETVWFSMRWVGSWKPLSVFLAVGHFVVPFFFLLPRTIKRNRNTLVFAALWILMIHAVDLYWLIMPTLHKDGAHLSAVDVAAWVGIGGCFAAFVTYRMTRAALVPVRDPRLPESLSFENA